jgi:MFS family permease
MPVAREADRHASDDAEFAEAMTADSIPAEAPYDLRHGIASAAVSLIAGITQSLGWQLVNTNAGAIQGALGASAAEATWLTTAYFATAITSVLLITKFRLQYGLRAFVNAGVACFLAVAVMHLFAVSLSSAIAVRAAHGIAAAPLAMVAILYMMQAFPKRLLPAGVVLGLGTLQLGGPLSRIVSRDLLEYGQWQGLYLLEVALAMICLAAVNAVKLDPEPRQKVLSRGDLVSFPLWAAGIALLCVVITQGRVHWWTDSSFIGVSLAAAIACLGLFAVVDLNRKRPLLNLGWIASPAMLRIVATVILFRLVVSEQAAVIGLLNVLGLNNDQMHALSLLVLAGTVVGFFIAIVIAIRVSPTAVGVLAAAFVAAGAWVDSHSSALTRVAEVYFSQSLLALAASMFFAASIMVGFGKIAAEGMKNAVSFFGVFPAAQILGSLLGTAWIATFVADRQEHNFAVLAERLSMADPQVAARVSQLAGSVAGVVPERAERAIQGVSLLAQQTTREAYVIAYNELFQLMAVIAVGLILWLLASAVLKRQEVRT